MDNADIGDDSIVGAGALVTMEKKFPARSLILGSPAKRVRELNEEELNFLPESAKNYVLDAKDYLQQSELK
jgi:carbonic anhydrase/acetyltransferase-like protein (isoleucine patch superfamily)